LSRLRPSLALPATLAAAACALLGSCGAGKPAASVPSTPPRSFVGLVSEDVIAGGAPYRARTLARERAAGVELLRQTVRWAEIEKSPGVYDFSFFDEFMAALAKQHMQLLPVLFDPPPFRSSAPRRGARRGTYPPRRPSDLGAFAARLVRRYGPHGRFWRERRDLPRVPIRAWQIWNEPNLPVYWPSGPNAAAYGQLLRATAQAIKAADPRAEVVSAGIAQSRLGVPFDRYVRALYKAGVGRADTFAIHPYAVDAEDAVAAVAATRKLLGDLGAHPPIWITEVGWASGGPASPFTVGDKGQAHRIDELFAGLARRRRSLGVRGIVYFGWKDARPFLGGHDFFGLHTGLLRLDGRPKPALAAFTRAARKLAR
jgi:hypothetical protein